MEGLLESLDHIKPRVGNEHQANIPTLLITEELSDNNSFAIGQSSVPIVWENCIAAAASSSARSEDEEPILGSAWLRSRLSRRLKMGSGVEKSASNGTRSPLPGCRSEEWTVMERESFVLGLYLFGKNLALVKRLVGTKKMGDVQCFYYGKFYKSFEYNEWSECLSDNNPSNRVSRNKIFAGWRHEKLMTRLFSLVSNDIRDRLIECSGKFTRKKPSGFEDYVFALKDIVGIDALVRAVGIGRGKQDLTKTPHRRPQKKAKPCSRSSPARGLHRPDRPTRSTVILFAATEDCSNSAAGDVPNGAASTRKRLPRNRKRQRATRDTNLIDEPSVRTAGEDNAGIGPQTADDGEVPAVASASTPVEVEDTRPSERMNCKEVAPAPRKFLFDLNEPYVPSEDEEETVTAGADRKVMFDLNIPYVPSPDSEAEMTDAEADADSAPILISNQSEEEPAAASSSSNGRRQSVRRRSLTERAYDSALQSDEVLSPKKRKKM